MSEQDLAIQARLLKVFPALSHLPQLASMAAKTGSIEAAIQAVDRYSRAEEQYNQRFTDSALSTLAGHVSEYMFGKDAPVENLPVMAREQATVAFARWVASDPERAARYDAFDSKLVGEFWPIYKAAMFDPVRRDAAAAQLSAHQTRPAVPVGGGSGVSTTPAPKKPHVDPEDEIFERAYTQFKEAGVGG
jgi:hypothetical protein